MFKLIIFLMMLFFVAIYFIPSFVAIGRKHAHTMQITILNAFLGWSFIAWVAALIWATTNHTDPGVKTKGSWIIISLIFIMSLMPLFVYSIIPTEYKSAIIQETYYRSSTYKIKSDKIIQEESETKKFEKD